MPIASQDPQTTIWLDPHDPAVVHVLDQRTLPHAVTMLALRTLDDAAAAIRDMAVRGAPLIGVTAAYGLYLAALHATEVGFVAELECAAALLGATRPTAVDLRWGLARQMEVVHAAGSLAAARIALRENAAQLASETAAACRAIGEHGLPLIEEVQARKGDRPVNVLTHCNAGWLACVAHGTATAPIYLAHERGVPVHVWVDETRPRNQGASLTAWELGRAGVPHTLIVDNAGGHLMQHGRVDLVITGADRIARNGDAANKIGTYLKALAARDNGIPFYIAAPDSTLDASIADGCRDIPIEERSAAEVIDVCGQGASGVTTVRIAPEHARAANPGFDVTPARLITGYITSRGVFASTPAGLEALFRGARS